MLKDVRVLEIAQGLAGPAAGLMLAELGADVLKIEPPAGDPGRADAAFASWNRSKRSLALDLNLAADRARLDELLAGADVLIHDLSPSRTKALRLDDEALAANHPNLIACSITGYPAGHRDADRPADELLVQARVGLLDEQDGFRDGPIVYRYPIGSWGAAHLAASGVLTRLLMRQKTGRGGAVNTSLLQGLLAPMSLVWSRIEKGPFSVRMPKPPGPNHTQMYQCAGGEWLQVMDPTGKLDYASLPLMWEVMAETGINIDNVEQLRAAIKTRPREAWLRELRAADIAVEPSTSLGEVLKHPEAEANTYVVEVDDAVWGKTRQAATPMHMSEPVTVRSPAPRLNEGGAAGWTGKSAPAAASSAETPPHPLSGLKVLDLGAFLAGPMAPSMLGDLGADVIKVEQISGDRMRFMTRYFHAAARNKRSIAVDLARPEGQEILARLVKWADLVHHNMRIKAAAKIGVDEPGLRRHNPDLVYGYVSAYGQKGERANWPGYDSVFQAIAGWEVENAGAGNPPIFSRAGTMDVLCAMNSLVGSLAALYHRAATGEAASAASSLLGVSCFTQGETLVQADGALAPFPRLDQNQTGVSPLRRIYETADGWVAVAASSDQAEALRTAFGAGSMSDLEAAARSQTSASLMARLEAEGVPAEIVLRDVLDHLFDDPAHKATDAIIAYQHAECGLIEHPGAFWSFSDATLRLADPLPPPLLGEHTVQILSEIGYSADDVARLRQDGVVAG
jgi:crotonobetainyl-CoA:carnitine CoA-transferase CaiB-like acyl-CoA transferase